LLEDHSKKEMRADGRTGLATMAWNGMTDHTSEAEQAQKQAQRRAQKLKEWVNKKIANGERVTAEEKKQFLEKLDEDEEKKRENKWNEFSRKSREKRERIEREMEARKAQEASKRMQVARR
jgi:nucleoid-associated protein YejK